MDLKAWPLKVVPVPARTLSGDVSMALCKAQPRIVAAEHAPLITTASL
jgi:hypothetical protein